PARTSRSNRWLRGRQWIAWWKQACWKAALSEAEQFLAEQEHRQGGQHAIEAVEDAAVPRDDVARVLGADVALEQALEQVADHREQHRRERHQRQRRQLRGRG